MEYLIRWEIEIIADTPGAAAHIAREIQLDPSSHATIFEVVDENDTIKVIDTMDID